jgi:tRNA-dihydrouridine synthase
MPPHKFAWSTLKKPFFVLAPMDGATDMVFRRVVAHCGRPDVFVTEFTNVEGLVSRGGEKVAQRLRFDPAEHPIIAQIWGTGPQAYFDSTKKLVQMGFDGIDINMGCPVRAVTSHGACSALIKNPTLAKEIIDAVREGAGSLPVSVKTRIGFHSQAIDTWIPFLLEQKLDALTVHLRTVAELSLVPAHWEEAAKIVRLRNRISPHTVLIGNGDIESVEQGEQKAQETGVDGIMIGRGVFHNPYVFNKAVDYASLSRQQKIALLRKHLDIFVDNTAVIEKHFLPLKRFFKIYIQGFDGASDLREQLMHAKNIQEVYSILS